jgi:hypothetical protein
VLSLDTGIGVYEHPFRLRFRVAGHVGRCSVGLSARLLRRAAHMRQVSTTLTLE